MVILVKYYDDDGKILEDDDDEYYMNIFVKTLNMENSNIVNTIPKLLQLDNYDNIYSIIIKDEIISDEHLNLIKAYPNKLKYFVCIGTYITKIPILPDTVEVINCSKNYIKEINPGKLPVLLNKLICSHNHIMTIPSITSGLFEVLNVENNSISYIPDDFTTSAREINIAMNYLQGELINLPNNLRNFNCNYNNITHITDLPEDLETLKCRKNRIFRIPFNLPKGLKYLDCGYNNIMYIHNLFNTKLEYLDCSHNQLHKLSIIPETTNTIICHTNRIRTMNIPETINTIICHSNSIRTINIPKVNNITRIDISNNYRFRDTNMLLRCKKLGFIDLTGTKVPEYYLDILYNYKQHIEYNNITYKTYKYSQQFWN